MQLITARLRLVACIPFIAYALLIAGCAATTPPPAPAPAMTATITSSPLKDGESIADYKARIKRESEAAVAYARQLAESEAESEIAKIKAEAAIAAERAKGEARNDFLSGVKTWTGWAMGVLVFVGLAALVLSFLPWTTFLGFDAIDSAKAFGFAAALSLGRYIMLRYGLAVGDVAAWVLIAALVVSAVITGLMVGKALLRGKLFTQAKVLEAKGEARAAVALKATALGKTTENVLDRTWRKAQANQ